MKLCLFGVLHGSPICRSRYLSRIADLFRDNGPPSFLAVEAAPRLFRDIFLPQREKFRTLAMADTEFTRYGTPFVDALAECIGFEADAHGYVYGSQEPAVLWLDEHRDYDTNDQGCAPSLGRNHYLWFKSYLDRQPQPCATVEEAFHCIHLGLAASGARNGLESPEHIYRRDPKWSELIRAKLREPCASTYAIVIAGLDHIESNPLSVLSILSGTVTCEALDITEA